MGRLSDIVMDRMARKAEAEGISWNALSEIQRQEYRDRQIKAMAEKAKTRNQQEIQQRIALEEALRKARLDNAVAQFSQKIPPKYRNADISDKAGHPIVSHLLEGRSCLITGQPGIGKTHILWAVAKEYVKQDAVEDSVLMVNLQDMLADVKEQGGENWNRYIKASYGQVRHLIIDEYDKIRASTADYVLLSDLVSYRYENELQTVIAGNGDKNLALSILGEAVFSRLCGTAEGGRYFALSGKDRRFGNENDK